MVAHWQAGCQHISAHLIEVMQYEQARPRWYPYVSEGTASSKGKQLSKCQGQALWDQKRCRRQLTGHATTCKSHASSSAETLISRTCHCLSSHLSFQSMIVSSVSMPFLMLRSYLCSSTAALTCLPEVLIVQCNAA